MELAKYKACICEGAAEEAIIDLLLDENLLIFPREEIIDEKVIKCRSAKVFESRYLRKDFNEKISILRILDSRREKFKISKSYEQKVAVINIITAPEIEMLIIFNENRYSDFKKSKKKPSDYCKENLKMSKVKSYEFVRNYFKNSNVLVNAIKKYCEISKIKNGEYSLIDIIKTNLSK